MQSSTDHSWPAGVAIPSFGLGWATLVGGFDMLLRRHYGVYEFSEDQACIFRIGLGTAQAPVVLGDGTRIAAGAPIGVLHFWNDHIHPFPPHGPDLRWAKRMQKRVRRSLQALAAHVEQSPDWAEVQAIHALAPVSRRLCAGRQIRRLACRHGFEIATGGTDPRGRLIVANILLWCFARAYNPGALVRFHPLQGHQELWLSRRTLLARYGGETAHRETT